MATFSLADVVFDDLTEYTRYIADLCPDLVDFLQRRNITSAAVLVATIAELARVMGLWLDPEGTAGPFVVINGRPVRRPEGGAA